MENLIEITSVPVIVAIVYAALALYKHFVKAEKWVRLIPLWAALLGVRLRWFESTSSHQTLTNTNTGVKKAFYVFRRGVFGIICKR